MHCTSSTISLFLSSGICRRRMNGGVRARSATQSGAKCIAGETNLERFDRVTCGRQLNVNRTQFAPVQPLRGKRSVVTLSPRCRTCFGTEVDMIAAGARLGACPSRGRRDSLTPCRRPPTSFPSPAAGKFKEES